MAMNDRDQQFERALARHLRDASLDSVCPDAGTLAAYHERTLSLEEMTAWKAHIAGCARCQQSLALVEQTEDLHVQEQEWQQAEALVLMESAPPPVNLRAAGTSTEQYEEIPAAAPVSEMPRTYRGMAAGLRWRWAAPLGAIAAAVIVWIGVQEVRTQHKQQMESVQVAQNRQAVPETPAVRPDVTAQLKKEQPAAKTPVATPPAQLQSPAAAPPSVLQQAQGYSPITSAPAFTTNESSIKEQENQEAAASRKVAVPQAVPPGSRFAARIRTTQPAPPSPAHAPASGAVDTGIVGGVAGGAAVTEKKSEPALTTTQTVTVESPAAALQATSTDLSLTARNESHLMVLAGEDRRYIVAPGEQHAWRVGDAGKIERSTDRGKTWKLQKSGVTADLTAGSATSDEICWVVGKAGTLLLTADGGKHWKSISSPISGDLGGIHATDVLHASIWDVANRKSFETRDGGVTWTPGSNE